MQRNRIAHILLLVAVFLLPWQTRWMYALLTIGGEGWEYGKLSLYATELLLLAVFCLRYYKSSRAYRTRKIYCLFFSALLISFLSAANTWLSLAALPHFLFAFLLFALLVDERTHIKSVATAFVVGLVIPSLLGWFQLLNGGNPASSWLGLASHSNMALGDAIVGLGARLLRAYGPYPHPNVFGGVLAFGILVWGWVWATAISSKKQLIRLVWLAVGFLLPATLVITFSRSAMLGFAFAILFGVVWMAWQRRRIPRAWLPAIGVVILAFGIIGGLFHGLLFSRVVSDSRLERISLSEREQGYRLAWQVISRSPVTGVGVGGYTATLADVVPGKPWWFYQPAHNIFLLALAEVGMVGFFLFGVIDFYILKSIWSARRVPAGIFWVMTAITLLVPALLDHYLWSLWAGLSLVAFAAGFAANMMEEKTS